jgi:cytoskeletal protein CcmA (bactofilin family)
MIFRRRDARPAAPQSAALSDPSASRLPAGVILRGRLGGVTHLVLSGRVIGEIVAAGELYVAPGGVVDGPVRARAVLVAGRIDGPVHGEERVELVAGAAVNGDITAAHVVVADGADLRGRVDVPQVRPSVDG